MSWHGTRSSSEMYFVSPGDMSATLLGRTRSSQALLDAPAVFVYRRPSERVPVAFTITAEALEQINQVWLAENGAYGDREVGGWLLAAKRFPDHVVAATDATIESRDGEMTMSPWYRAGDHLLAVGCWHTEPSASDGVPSETDLRGQHEHLLHLLDQGRDRTLDLICVPRGDGSLQLHGWATRLRAGVTARAKCEPAHVEVTG